MKRITLLSSVVMTGIAAMFLASSCAGSTPEPPARDADGRPILTEEQLARLQIHPVEGKDGLYVIPGFDGRMSGGNVAVRVTGDGVIIVDDKFPYSHDFIAEQVASVTSAIAGRPIRKRSDSQPARAHGPTLRVRVHRLANRWPRMDMRSGQRTRLRSDATTTGLLGRATGGPGARRDAGDAVSPGHAAETQERLRRSFSSGIAPEGTVANQIHHSPTPEAHLVRC